MGGYCWSRSGGRYTGLVEGTVLGAAQSGKQEVGRDAVHLDLQESK